MQGVQGGAGWVAGKLRLADFVPTWGFAKKVMFYTCERALSGPIEKLNTNQSRKKCYPERSRNKYVLYRTKFHIRMI